MLTFLFRFLFDVTFWETRRPSSSRCIFYFFILTRGARERKDDEEEVLFSLSVHSPCRRRTKPFFFFLKCSLPLSPVSRSLYPLPALSVIRITNKSMEVEEQEEKPLSLFPLNSLLPPPLLSYPCCAAALALAAALAPAPTACSTFP